MGESSDVGGGYKGFRIWRFRFRGTPRDVAAVLTTTATKMTTTTAKRTMPAAAATISTAVLIALSSAKLKPDVVAGP